MAKLIVFGATGLALLVATVTRDALLFLVAAGGAASAAVIWGRRTPLE